MRKSILFFLVTIITFSCSETEKKTDDNRYTINGSINKELDATVFIKERKDGQWIEIDSVQMLKGQFAFEGDISYPVRYYIQIPSTMSLVPFFLEASDIEMTIDVDSIDNTVISGSASNDEYEAFLDQVGAYDKDIKKWVDAYKTAREQDNQALVKKFQSTIDSIYELKDDFVMDYMLDNNKSFVTPYIAYRNIFQLKLKDLEEVVESLDPSSVYVRVVPSGSDT